MPLASEQTPATDPIQTPWWRVRMVWLVIAGPLCVVVASLVTVTIAVRGADDILTTDSSSMKSAHSHVPAVQARNHVVGANR